VVGGGWGGGGGVVGVVVAAVVVVYIYPLFSGPAAHYLLRRATTDEQLRVGKVRFIRLLLETIQKNKRTKERRDG
jgi:hypothetical protein